MRIVHINTYDGNGGAGRACLRLNRALKKEGVDSTVWVGYKFSANPDVHSFSSNGFSKAIAAFKIVLERLVSSFVSKPLRIPFSVPLWGQNITETIALKNADIIHIHWINHAFLSPRYLRKLSKLNKPIVWTFHDSNAFTGGCHVRYDCDHFENECGNCPILKNSHPRDLSHKIWKSKSRAYEYLNFEIIAPSSWMAGSVKRSKLMRGRSVNIIPNTLETDIFKPYDKAKARKMLGIPESKFIMLSGFMPSRKDLHKGTSYLLEALQLLKSEQLIDVELIVFGNRDERNIAEFPVKTTFLGTISNDEKLAMCYSAADVFITPSLEDNLPYTVMECLSCATPVVAFTTGGIPDMVDHKVNGYLAKYKSADDLARGIVWVYNHTDREALNQSGRAAVKQKFDENTIARHHIELYRKVLKESSEVK
ncbi:glycosyltransferase involved in cell wall biosynthesis [Arcticibacter tournemirensis]|uniref:Glycosyltransferase n=1 Tax=Arcticibacter tournemirensis TaxID=699437 RepID=A0A5M9H672_9SPHI|nr:glycosyltransferase family 4 protein [Arcticibacter tournemirensis]KAA8481645.1 glycosyltransferase [Arcticibacter tournemirensis]TQM48958.1 glycosyltransferase involved in cell wall biosynthesis [Arcticibacter tournemirensis]